MSRCLSPPALGLLLGTAVWMAGCDPRTPSSVPTPKASAAAPSGDFPAGIKPADSSDKVEAGVAHKGPSEGGAAVGGMSGPGSGGPVK